MCIVLADPPSRGTNPNAIAFPNLGLLYLAAYLRQRIPGLAIHYINGACTISEHLERIAKLAPDMYGLSVASSFSELAYELIREIKRRAPRLPVVCGGPHPTTAPHEILSNSPTDICCLGEGEETLLEIVSRVRAGESFQSIPGTATRDDAGTTIVAPPRPLISNLDEIPFPAWDLIRFEDYSGCRKALGKPSIAIIASRGCPFNCVFCSNPVWRLHKPWLRLRSPTNIAAEVQVLYDQGIREISIMSDEMNPGVRWAIAVFDAISDLKLAGLHLQCQLRAKPVTRELAAAMQRAGCWLCYIGVESTSRRVLDGIGKHVTSADVESAARTLKEFGIKIYAFIMLYQVWQTGAKLEVETTREVLHTLLFVLRMRMKGQIDFSSCGFTTSYPGSALHEITLQHNLNRPRRRQLQVWTPQDITLRLPGIPHWQMLLSRTLGLATQAVLFLLAAESYRTSTLRQNVRQAGYKLGYFLGLR